MKPDEVMTLYDFAWWTRDRLLGAAAGMTDEEFAVTTGSPTTASAASWSMRSRRR